MRKFLAFIGFSFVAYAQSHGIEIIEAKNIRISSEHAALVRKYVLNLSTPGTDGTPGGGAAVVQVENNYYLVTAKHCLKVRDASQSSSLKQRLHAYYSNQNMAVELDLLKDVLEVREMGDLVRIKLPASHELVKRALSNHAIIKIYNGSLSAIKNEVIFALGRPQCLAGQSYVIHCKGDQCLPSQRGERPEIQLSNGKCFESTLKGMSGGPVLVKMNSEYFYLGAVSQHAWVGKTFGPIVFAPTPELGAGNWKKCTVLVEKGDKVASSAKTVSGNSLNAVKDACCHRSYGSDGMCGWWMEPPSRCPTRSRALLILFGNGVQVSKPCEACRASKKPCLTRCSKSSPTTSSTIARTERNHAGHPPVARLAADAEIPAKL